MPQAEREAGYKAIGEWFGTHGRSGKIVGGEELQHRRTAKTVRFSGKGPIVTDGPYLEAKELIGGYVIVEVADEQEALQLATSWPGRSTVDWPDILGLYDLLVSLEPSLVARLNRAIALRYVAGADAALAEVESLADGLARYPYLHATRAELLRELGDDAAARAADARALELTSNPAERELLLARLA